MINFAKKGIEIKSSDISIGSKPLNSEVDDLIEKHFVPTKNRSPVGPVVTGHSHSATLSNTIETALFLENAESIESAESACKGIGRVVDDGLGGNLPGTESVGCNHNPAPADAAKGHIRLAKGGLKSEFVFSVNAHNLFDQSCDSINPESFDTTGNSESLEESITE